MKERELRQHTHCALCKQAIGDAGLPSFWTITIERHGIDLHAVRRQDGLAAHLASPMLAQVMGPDEDMTMPLMEPLKLTVCETCAVESRLPIAAMVEER